MTSNNHNSAFDSGNSSLDSTASAQQLFESSQNLCQLVDKVPVLALRLLSAPVSIDRSPDYDTLIETNGKIVSFLLRVAEHVEVSVSYRISAICNLNVSICRLIPARPLRLRSQTCTLTQWTSTNWQCHGCPPSASALTSWPGVWW